MTASPTAPSADCSLGPVEPSELDAYGGFGARVVRGLLLGYQLVLSPWVTQQCRYYPSCSAYALEAVRVHGAVRGLALAARRLLRCHPFTDGGVDYVPGSPDAVSYASRTAAEATAPSAAPAEHDGCRSFAPVASMTAAPPVPSAPRI